MAGIWTSGEGKGARPSLRLLAPCPDVAPRCSELILLLPAAMPGLTIARPTQHSGSKFACRLGHPGVDSRSGGKGGARGDARVDRVSGRGRNHLGLAEVAGWIAIYEEL